MKFTAAKKYFLDIKERKGRKDNTLTQYAESLDQFEEFSGIINIEDIDSDIIEDFLGHLEDKKLSSATIGIRYTCLFTFLKFLKNKGKITLNPIKDGDTVYVERPTVRHKDRIAVHGDEYQTMIKLCESLQEKCVLGLMFRCGLRIGAVEGLKKEDIRKGGKVIYIKVTTKGDKTGEVPLIPIFKDEQTWLLKYIKNLNSGDYLFPKLSQPSAYNLIQRLANDASITKKISPHSFRHGAAVDLLAHGVPEGVVQQILMHTNISTTQIYTKMVPSKLADTIERLYS